MIAPKHLPRTSGAGPRSVLIPGTRKAAPHPWRDRLLAARQGRPGKEAAA